jgi:hypothetical protein
LQDHAIGILQLNASRASRNGTAGSDRAIRAFDRTWSSQIEGSSNKLGGRGADREADAHTRYAERIAPASEDQYTIAAADSDNEAALGKDNRDPAGFGMQWRTDTSHACEQGNQGDACTKSSHDFSFL